MAPLSKQRAPRNKTITISPQEVAHLQTRLITVQANSNIDPILDRTIWGDALDVLKFLPTQFVDLMVVDPPYNLTKSFNGTAFHRSSLADYESWLESWIVECIRLLKPDASIYICGDWQSSTAIHRICDRYFTVHNRIAWEREKGRGARHNWKNCTEDIWFCSVSKDYYFNVDAVKMKRRVLAPYRDQHRNPKDWQTEKNGKFRVTHPSNFWSDISVPFWSMPENTDHPTQKPEKLIAKLLLASSETGDVVFDPFLGSGTTSVVAKKLGRHYIGIEKEFEYCCLAEKRLAGVHANSTIQGYAGGYFWERNTLAEQRKSQSSSPS